MRKEEFHQKLRQNIFFKNFEIRHFIVFGVLVPTGITFWGISEKLFVRSFFTTYICEQKQKKGVNKLFLKNIYAGLKLDPILFDFWKKIAEFGYI